MNHSGRCRTRIVLFLAVCSSGLFAENLFRNASFEETPRDIVPMGYNRYFLFQDEASSRIGLTPPEKKAPDEALEDIEGQGKKLGWRVVEDDKAFHGRLCLRTDLKETCSFGMEVEAGTYTFSAYARTKEKNDVLRLVVEDIRGEKGEVVYRQAKSCDIGPEWTRCEFTCTVLRGPVSFSVETLGDGTVWVDALQLEPGQKATPFELHPWDRTPPAGTEPFTPFVLPQVTSNVKPEIVVPASALEPKALSGIAAVPTEVAAKPGKPGTVGLHIGVETENNGTDGIFPLPASGGIPLPRGALFDDKHATVFDETGKEVLCQTRVLSRHVLDGSIQMLLVDLMVDGKVGGDAVPPASSEKRAAPVLPKFQLKYGPEVIRDEGAKTPLSVTEDKDRIVVGTGPLTFAVRKSGFNLFDSLEYDADGDGKFSEAERAIVPGGESGCWTGDPAGRTYWSSLGPVESVRVEERGPVRCCIAAAGSHQSREGHVLFRYIVRIHAYAGKAYLRVDHTFSNEQPPYATIMTGAGIRLGLKPGAFTDVSFPDGHTISLGQNEEVYFVSPDTVRRWTGSNVKTTRAQSDGRITVSGREMGITGWIREWNWMPPKEFAFAPDKGLDLCVWPRHLTRGFCCPLGVSRTHRIWLCFHRSKPAKTAADDPRARQEASPFFPDDARVEADPAWYCDSEVFGRLAPKDEKRIPEFENMLARKGEGTFGRFPRPGEYTWYNFITYGDDRGDLGWGNMETMIDHCMFLLYVRSLDPWYYRRACDAALHYRDVDMCHPWGQTRVHCHNHTNVPWDCSHDWIKGVLDHYLLTGDNRSLEVAHEHGRWLLTRPIEYQIARGSRRFTRIVQNLADLYRFTGHKQYLDNFTARIDKAEELRAGRTDLSRFQLGLLQEPQAQSYGRTGFEQWYAFAGVMEMARATEDERWKKMLIEEMAFVLPRPAKGEPPPDLEAYRRWGASVGKSMIEADTRTRMYLPCLTYLSELTGDKNYSEAAKYAALYATNDEGYKDWWPNLNYAGLAYFAYGLFEPMKAGMGPEDEARIRSETKAIILPSALRDAGFEDVESGYRAWGTPNERQNAEKVLDIVKDSQMKAEGQTSLRMSEKAVIDKLAKKKVMQFPPRFSRQRLYLRGKGCYEFSGLVRFAGSARPDIVIDIDTDSGKRERINFDLPKLLPEPVYADVEKGPDTTRITSEATEGEKAKEAEVNEPDLEEKKDRPEDHWWKFRVAFEIKEPSVVRVGLLYVFGLKPPGTIWFDDFRLVRLDATPAELGKVTVEKQ